QFEVPLKWAMISTLVKTTLEGGTHEACFTCVWLDKTATEVPLPKVSTDKLRMVVTFMEYHRGVEPPLVEKPLRSRIMSEVCKDPWDAKYIDAIGETNKQDLYDLILV